MKPTLFPTRLLPLLALALALFGAQTAVAQETETPAPPSDMEETASANAEARTEYGAALEAARAANEQRTPEGFIEAAGRYVAAAEIAEASGDAELEAQASTAREAAVKAYVDAGDAYSAASDYASAATQYEAAADVAEQIGNADLQAKSLSKATLAYVDAEDFAAALERIDAAIVLIPDDLSYSLIRATALSKSGDLEAASEAFSDLITRAEEAEDATTLTRAQTALGTLYLGRANAAFRADRYTEAIGLLDQAAEYLAEDDSRLNTLYAGSYYKMGVAQVQSEQYDAAQRSLRRAQEYAQRAGNTQIANGAQQQLDYIQQVQASQG